MASTAKSRRSSARDLAAHVASRLLPVTRPGDRVLLALSGGVDSVVLLDILTRVSKRLGLRLRAMHVNHQLSPNASSWASFCRRLCRARGVPCVVKRVEVARGNSTERAARDARYAALTSARADFVALAHNADDQAETVLLQLLRGSGVKGLSAMPVVTSARPALVRPLLDVTRTEIEAYAARHALEWIEDESNASGAYLRNWLRHEIAPRIAERVPAYRTVLSRAARHFADAATLLDDLARIDADGEQGLSVARLKALAPARARNLLRYALREQGFRMPDEDRLNEALRQGLSARGDARLEVDLGDCVIRRKGDTLRFTAPRRSSPSKAILVWRGEREIALPHLDGVLAMQPARGTGMSLARLQAQPVTIRTREGGERLRPASNRPTRSVKNLLQEADVAAWERDRLPFIYSGDALACIPGVAVDHRFAAAAGEESIVPAFRPARPAAARKHA